MNSNLTLPTGEPSVSSAGYFDSAADDAWPMLWNVAGVAGSGKTALGRKLSEAWNCDFIEGDRRHSEAAIAKMVCFAHAQLR